MPPTTNARRPARRHALTLALLLAGCGGGGGGGAPAGGGGSGGGGPPPPPAPSCVAIDLSGPALGPPAMTPCAGACTCTSRGLIPLPDLGTGTYFGVEGGLYCGGSNTRPAAHEAAGLAAAASVVPRDAAGAPSAAGAYVFVSIGMSNTTQEFAAFVPLANAVVGKDPRLVIVDGAQGGQAVEAWSNPAHAAWTTLDARLTTAGVTPAQVAVAWIKLAAISPTLPFPQDAQALADGIAATVRNAKARYPNLAVAYLSSRIYGGYATTNLNPEPFAYQSAFAVKRVVLDQVTGDPALNANPAAGAVVAPWIAWGPYLWADGTTPRGGDGLTWPCSDLSSDGVHPATSGRAKVAQLLLDFVTTDSTAKAWFLGP